MIRNRKLTMSLITAVTFCTTPAMAVVFGSNNDGLGGFTQSTLAGTGDSWATQTDSVTYTNATTGFLNSSFLGEFVLDRTDGKAYTITGVVTLTGGYADDNNRVGFYLFGDTAEIPNQSEVGALGLVFNMDDDVIVGAPGSNTRDYLQMRDGIDGSPLHGLTDRTQNITPYAQDLFGTQITFTANIAFVGTDVQVGGSMTTADGEVTTIDPVTLAAADYAGDYFGFVTRARVRNLGVEGDPQSAPWVMDYMSFTIEEASAAIPGDTDGDGDVDDSDLGTSFSNYTGPGGTGKTAADGDTDGDGDVDDGDLGTSFSNYTGPLGPAVPEPTSLALLGLGGLALARRRRA